MLSTQEKGSPAVASCETPRLLWTIFRSCGTLAHRTLVSEVGLITFVVPLVITLACYVATCDWRLHFDGPKGSPEPKDLAPANAIEVLKSAESFAQIHDREGDLSQRKHETIQNYFCRDMER